MRKPLLRRQRVLSSTLLAMALVAATWPAWRFAFFSPRPTVEELSQLICTTTVKR